MIEGKLGHHFQVDEMRHIPSPACPAFAGCKALLFAHRTATLPSFHSRWSTFGLKLLSARTGSSACPVYVVYQGFRKELVLIWQHLLQLISAASPHCWVRKLSAERVPPASSRRLGQYPPRGNNQAGSSTARCPRTAQRFPSDRLRVTPPF